MKLQILLLACQLFLFFPVTSLAGEPPTTPFIRINTEMHSAKIMDIAANPGGKLLATASFDKTVKIWDTATGKLIRTIRPPVGAGNEGTLNAVAFSADGKSVATGGNTGKSWDKGNSVYIFDVQSGEMTQHIRNLPEFVYRLAYSPDGSRLAVAFNNGRGVSVFSTSDYKLLWSDNSYKGACYGIDFDRNGNLAVVSDKGNFKMYRPAGTLIFDRTTEEGVRVFSLRFSPDDKHIALGYDDYNSIEVRNATDGTLAFSLEKPAGNWPKGLYSSIAWTTDGKHILAAGGVGSPDARKVLTKWSISQKSLEDQLILPIKNGITHLIQLKDGSIVFLSRLSGFGVLSGEGGGRLITLNWNIHSKYNYTEMNTNGGGLNFYHPLATADFRKNHDSFKISADASNVLFSYERQGQAKAMFDLKKRKLITDSISETDLIAPRVTGNGVDIKNWESWGTGSPPRLNKKKLKGFWYREANWSLAVSHDDSGFILGSIMNIRSYSKSGKLLWQKRVPGTAWDVNITPDDRTLVAALDDSTIRWYRMQDGEEQYALYLHPDRKRWVLWLPDGFFDHGPDSDDLIGYLVNRGSDKASIMVGVDQMYDIFYRPDIIDRAIAGEDISAYLQKLTARYNKAGIAKEPPSADAEKTAREKSAQDRTSELKIEEGRKVSELADKEAAESTSRRKAEEEQIRLKTHLELKTKQLQEIERAKNLKIEQEQANKLRLEQEQEAERLAEKERRDAAKISAEKHVEEGADNNRLRQEQVQAGKTVPDDNQLSGDESFEDPVGYTPNIALTDLLNMKTLPPRVRFISKSGSTESRDFTLKAELCDGGGGIGNVTLFMNNTPIAFERGDRGMGVHAKFSSQACQNFERVITLAPGRNIISLMAFNSGNNIESNRDQVTLNYLTTDTDKPRLHILTIAVNSYRDGDLRLKYSINDAEGLIKMASEKGRTLFAGIDIYRLHDEQVTREKMEAIFSQIGARTKRGDVFLLFMAGHGLTDDTDGMYYFLPVNFRYTGQDSVASQGISMNDFKRFLINIQAMKTLLLIDTCNSGSFSEAVATRGVTDKTAITKLARSVGRATIAASSKNQVALEGYEGHGVFSYTLLEGMEGKAADKKGEISISRLATFIEETLPELTFKKWGYEQIPQKSLIGSDFQIGVK
jgi:WD40 repeat protein